MKTTYFVLNQMYYKQDGWCHNVSVSIADAFDDFSSAVRAAKALMREFWQNREEDDVWRLFTVRRHVGCVDYDYKTLGFDLGDEDLLGDPDAGERLSELTATLFYDSDIVFFTGKENTTYPEWIASYDMDDSLAAFTAYVVWRCMMFFHNESDDADDVRSEGYRADTIIHGPDFLDFYEKRYESTDGLWYSDGAAFKRDRNYAGLTQPEAAKILGISFRTIQEWESDRHVGAQMQAARETFRAVALVGKNAVLDGTMSVDEALRQYHETQTARLCACGNDPMFKCYYGAVTDAAKKKLTLEELIAQIDAIAACAHKVIEDRKLA